MGYGTLTLLLFLFGTLHVYFSWRKILVLFDKSVVWLPSVSSFELWGKPGRVVNSMTFMDEFSILSAQLLLCSWASLSASFWEVMEVV